MSPMLKGGPEDILPKHWLDNQEGWTCSNCNESFSQDEESFPHPDPKYVTLPLCVNCRTETDQ